MPTERFRILEIKEREDGSGAVFVMKPSVGDKVRKIFPVSWVHYGCVRSGNFLVLKYSQRAWKDAWKDANESSFAPVEEGDQQKLVSELASDWLRPILAQTTDSELTTILLGIQTTTSCAQQ